MNDYQQRENEKSAELRAELKPIAKALGWELLPDNISLDYPARTVYMRNADGLEIGASEPWNKSDKLEFNASKWPTHTDRRGAAQRTHPGDAYQPREITPTTTATRTRTPEAIARQIKNKIIPDYVRIYARLQEVADDRQAYADKETKLIAALFVATQEEDRTRNDGLPYFVRSIKGLPLTIKYRSSGSVTIDLDAEEMVAVIEFLRAKRNAEK